jgi:DNA-binding NarL/FixJ family response regulator
MPIRVLLADDSELIRCAIRQLLADRPEITVVGESTDFTHTLQLCKDLRANVVILDLHMSDGNRISAREFKSHLPTESRVLAISVWNDAETKALAEGYGAVKLLDKVSLGTHLIPSILEIASPSSENHGADIQ